MTRQPRAVVSPQEILDRPLVVRLPKRVKVAVRLDAIDCGQTVQQWVTEALEEHLARVRR